MQGITRGQFGEMDDPTASGAVEIGHVYVHGIDVARGENLLWLRAWGQRGKIRRADTLGWVIEGGIRIRALQAQMALRQDQLPTTEARRIRAEFWRAAADADADVALSCPTRFFFY